MFSYRLSEFLLVGLILHQIIALYIGGPFPSSQWLVSYLFISSFIFETGSHVIAQAGLNLSYYKQQSLVSSFLDAGVTDKPSFSKPIWCLFQISKDLLPLVQEQ